MKVLSLPEFVDLIRIEFAELPAELFTPDSRIIEDLGLDSLELFRLLGLVESLAPIELPDIELKDLTLEGVYFFYEANATRVSDQ